MKNSLVWIDVETTGLDPKKDKLLQIAVVLTDRDFNEKYHFNWIVKQNSKRAYKKADNTVREMHEKTGLWDKLENGDPIQDIDRWFANLLKIVKGDSKWLIKIGGNSVNFDLNFIKKNLPSSAEYLSHQVNDISAVLSFMGIIGEKVTLDRTPRTHDALDDIRDTLKQARAIKAKIKN